jgi:hypothetical protein
MAADRTVSARIPLQAVPEPMGLLGSYAREGVVIDTRKNPVIWQRG